MSRSSASAFLLALLTAPSAAQSGGFQAGDLYLYNPAFQGLSTSDGAIVHVEPGTGAISLLVDLETSSSGPDQMAYDPWRDRLIFFGGLVPNHNEVYLCDAAGSLASLGFGVTSGPSVGRFAPRGDGLIYFTSYTAPLYILYFDAANQVQTLMDASGTAPYLFPTTAGSIRQLEFHAPTNSLVAATAAAEVTCPGGSFDALNLRRLELSPDGARVLAETCFQYDLNPGFLPEVPMGLAPGPLGDLALHVDDNSAFGVVLPRVARVHVAAGIAAPFAASTTPATSGGAYSQLLGKAVVLDSLDDVLRAYAAGDSGSGAVVASGTGTPGGSGETAALVEIQPAVSGFGLAASPHAISLSAGGAQAWTIALGPAHAGELHLVVGSLAGWTPGTPVGGVPVPLLLDVYALWSLAHQNSAVLQGTLGVLDAQGAAAAAFVLPPGSDPGLAGIHVYHAALALAGGGVVTAATNPAPLALLP